MVDGTRCRGATSPRFELRSSQLFSLVLSREWVNGLWKPLTLNPKLLFGDHIGTTIGIHSPIPYEAPDSLTLSLSLGPQVELRNIDPEAPKLITKPRNPKPQKTLKP